MKKTILSLAFMLTLGISGAYAQTNAPSCQNDNGLEGRIGAIEAQGWREISRTFYPVFYKIAPTPPYLVGTLEIIFGQDCPPGTACPENALLYREDANQQSINTCVWSPNHNQ